MEGPAGENAEIMQVFQGYGMGQEEGGGQVEVGQGLELSATRVMEAIQSRPHGGTHGGSKLDFVLFFVLR